MALHEHAYAEGRVGDSYRMAEISGRAPGQG